MLNLHLPYLTQKIKTMMMLRRAATKQASLFPGLAAPRSAMFYSTQPSNIKDDALTTANELHVNEDALGLQTGQVSGAPQELQDRTVQIYKMSPSSTQSGRQQQKGWRLNWDIIPRARTPPLATLPRATTCRPPKCTSTPDRTPSTSLCARDGTTTCVSLSSALGSPRCTVTTSFTTLVS